MRQLEFRKFRFLFFVLGLTLLAALWEFTDPDPAGNPQEVLFPSTWAELYPDSADTHYSAALGDAEQGDFTAARNHFEQAIATGDKTKEELHYDYAVLLVRMKADREAIDQAVGNWKRLFPFSTRPDPMTAADAPAKRID